MQDLYCGADPKYRLSVRYVSPNAWHMAFVRNMFIRPEATELPTFDPNFTVLHAPEFQADPAKHGTRTSTFIVLNLAKRMILIGGTRYAGELKKSMFTVMNYYMPKQGVLSMHCSANIGKAGRHGAVLRPVRHRQDHALRRSGALAHRRRRARLVAEGVFNYEGGCYAKVINLSRRGRARHLSHHADVRDDPRERRARSDDAQGEVRGPVDHREHARVVSAALHPEPRAVGRGGHPKNIVFLTADAFGVLPPDREADARPGDVLLPVRLHGEGRGHGARREGAAGDVLVLLRRGVPRLASDEVRRDARQADRRARLGRVAREHRLERRRVRRRQAHEARAHARDGARAARGELAQRRAWTTDPVFGLAVPTHVAGVPDEVLNPRDTWPDKAAYDAQAKKLAAMFRENFEKFEKFVDGRR